MKIFLDTLKEIRDGAAMGELDEAIQSVVAAVRATGKAGRVTLTLDVSPMKKGGANTLLVEDNVKIALPAFDRPGTILYATDDNTLSRKDPRQPDLVGLRDVNKVAQMPERGAGNE